MSTPLLDKLILKDGVNHARKKQLNIEIGQQIKFARENARMTQEELAESVEVSPQYISDLERGVVGISISTLKRVCICIGVSADQILFGEGDSNFSSVIGEKYRFLNPRSRPLLLEIIDRFIEACG